MTKLLESITLDRQRLQKLALYFEPSLFTERLSASAFAVISWLTQGKGRPRTSVQEIQSALDLSRFDIDWAVRLFESLGYLVMELNEVDWDRTTVTLTPRGLALPQAPHPKPLPERVRSMLRELAIDEGDLSNYEKLVEKYYNQLVVSQMESTPSGRVQYPKGKIGSVIRAIEHSESFLELRFLLRLRSFAEWFKQFLGSTQDLIDSFRKTDSVILWLDTNFLVSLISPKDVWYEISRSLLKTAADVRRKTGISFIPMVSEDTLGELQGLLAEVIRRVSGHTADELRSGRGLAAEYTARVEIPTAHAFANELSLRLQASIHIHQIHRQVGDFPVAWTELDEAVIEEKIDPKRPGRPPTEYAREFHDLKLLWWAHKCLAAKKGAWVWTFDHNLPAIEERAYRNNYCAISNLYIASVLESIDYLLSSNSGEDAALEVWRMAQVFFASMVREYDHLQALMEEIKASLTSLREGGVVPSLWSVPVQIAQRTRLDFGDEAARKVIARQRDWFSAVEGSWEVNKPRAVRRRKSKGSAN